MDAKWIVLLLAAISHTVSSAPESVFALEGSSVTLNMKGSTSLDPDDAVWIFNQSYDVVRYYPHHPKSRQLRVPSPYKGRVEFNLITYSLELRNPQKTDSGLYRGELNAEGRKNVIEYRLSVIEQISAPVMTVEPVSCDRDLCNVTVTCRTEDLNLTSTCNNSCCTQKEQTAAFSSLNIHIKDGAIICNHSNPICWRYVTVEIDTVLSEARPNDNTQNIGLWTGIAVGVGLVIIVIFGVIYFRKRSKSAGGNTSKVYQSVGQIVPVELFPSADIGKDQSVVVGGKGLGLSPGSAVKKRSPLKLTDTQPFVVVDLSQNALALSPAKSPSGTYFKVKHQHSPGHSTGLDCSF